MRSTVRLLIASTILICASAAVVRGAPTPFQRDRFQDGTTQDWSNGATAAEPVNIPSGGSAGTADRYLKINAKGGVGGGSRLLVYNRSQWTGDFTAASLIRIEMDLLNLSQTPLTIRIGLREFLGSGFSSEVGFPLPADGAWHHASFGLAPDDLEKIGSVPLETVLADVSEMRIFHSKLPSLMGDAINASFGVDNITAVSSAGNVQRPSDMNQDGSLDLSDAINLLVFLFVGGIPPLPCGDGTPGDPANQALLDATGDGQVDLADAIGVLDYLFLGKSPPVLGASCAFLPGCPDNSANCASGA